MSPTRGLVFGLAVAVLVVAMSDEASAKLRHGRSRDRSPRDAESRSLFGMENYTLCGYKVRRWQQEPRHSPASLTEVVCQNAGSTCSNGDTHARVACWPPNNCTSPTHPTTSAVVLPPSIDCARLSIHCPLCAGGRLTIGWVADRRVSYRISVGERRPVQLELVARAPASPLFRIVKNLISPVICNNDFIITLVDGEAPVEQRLVRSNAGMQGRGKGDIPEKTRRPAASSGTIFKCKNSGATNLGIEACLPTWEVSSLTTRPPRPRKRAGNVFMSLNKKLHDINDSKLCGASEKVKDTSKAHFSQQRERRLQVHVSSRSAHDCSSSLPAIKRCPAAAEETTLIQYNTYANNFTLTPTQHLHRHQTHVGPLTKQQASAHLSPVSGEDGVVRVRGHGLRLDTGAVLICFVLPLAKSFGTFGSQLDDVAETSAYSRAADLPLQLAAPYSKCTTASYRVTCRWNGRPWVRSACDIMEDNSDLQTPEILCSRRKIIILPVSGVLKFRKCELTRSSKLTVCLSSTGESKFAHVHNAGHQSTWSLVHGHGVTASVSQAEEVLPCLVSKPSNLPSCARREQENERRRFVTPPRDFTSDLQSSITTNVGR
ncbi:hypothetical protein PR048_022134 [Dryococelus australis]|uniref:Uncharacterized protein n=1 Tax=Dryococelus australis TaxID=614101 RepID=A0ABQ9H055_9NEOP|nr:hypothetical protein PR048_022134 [Dryococelus australis]